MNDSDLLLWLRVDLTVGFLLFRRLNCSLSHSRSWLFDDALASTLRLLIHGASPGATIRGDLLCLLLLRRHVLDGGWRVPRRSLNRFFLRLARCRLLGILSRCWGGSFLSPTHQFLDILLILLAEHTCSLFSFEQQIVSRCDVVKSISLDFLLSLLGINAMVLYKHTYDLLIDWNGLIT